MSRYRGDSPSPPPEERRRRSGFLRRCERCCTVTLRHFPLALVYGLTTWAIYTQVRTCLLWQRSSSWQATILLILSLILYGLLNWCYTVAVFTDPGSPLSLITSSPSFSRHNYSHLPTAEDADVEQQSITVKSTGQARFCKKCQNKKPDRAHHCSTCGRCVLKMDHHCPWLATCVGMRNYKPFLLFCSYVTVFCWLCFFVSAAYIWGEISSASQGYADGDFQAINTVLLAVVAGVFGLVLTGFTGWHISLAVRNQTTIECLEKTRYLNPIRKTMDRATHAFDGGATRGAEGFVNRYGHQLAEIHANAIPGITGPEEGEERPSPVVEQGPMHVEQNIHPQNDRWLQNHNDQDQHQQHTQTSAQPPHPGHPLTPSSIPHLSAHQSLQRNYSALERQREVERYESYLDEQESVKMPHAFDLGWRRNLQDLFGPEPWLWVVPVCNTVGDGWNWATSPTWAAAQLDRQARKEARLRESQQNGREATQAQWNSNDGVGNDGVYAGADVPMYPIRPKDDASSLDGLYASDVEQSERVQSPRQSDEWKDWD